MNKLIVPLTVISVLGLFNAYSSFGQSKTENTERITKQSAKQQSCANAKESCCKSEKAKRDNCCACCTGTACAAGGSHCCGG